MLFANLPKIFAVIFAVALLTAPMADAADGADNGIEKAKEAVNEMVTEGVTETRQVHEHDKRARKPRIGNMGVRQSWNECVGMDASEAVEVIRAARPDLKKIIMVKQGTMVTADMRLDRVRVYYDEENIVTRPPRVG